MVYVNGQEAFRTNLPSGTITPETRAIATTAGSDESRLPAMVVQTPEQVVDVSLAALEKDQVVCATSTFVGVSAALSGLLPRGVSRRLGLALAKRTFDRD